MAEYGKKDAEDKLDVCLREIEVLKSRLRSVLSNQSGLEAEPQRAHKEVAELEGVKAMHSQLVSETGKCCGK